MTTFVEEWRTLVEKQRNETPAEIMRWGEDLYPGGVTYCAAPSNYVIDHWGVNQDGDSWMWYFCVTDDFGNLQPQPRDTMWYEDQRDEMLDVYWGGKPGNEVSKIRFNWFQYNGQGCRVIHWDSGVVGTVTSTYDPTGGISFDAEDLNPDYPDQPALEIVWDDDRTQRLNWPNQCRGIFALV